MLISDRYRALQADLHKRFYTYGSVQRTDAPKRIAALMQAHEIRDVLDYGAGKQRLKDALRDALERDFAYRAYEPADERFSAQPEPAELVVCCDVLEHVEPEFLDAVLDDLARCTERFAYVSVHCRAAQKTLADGRNAHLIQRSPEWWIPRLVERMDVQLIERTDSGFMAVLRAKVR